MKLVPIPTTKSDSPGYEQEIQAVMKSCWTGVVVCVTSLVCAVSGQASLTGGYTHDLQILDIQLSDQGFYKCSAGPASIIWHLDVLEAETLPTPADPDGINITDCCVAKNVSESCLPACYPPDIDLDNFNVVLQCGQQNDVVGLMECLTGQ
ncbi:hypothetical protein ElyMa_001780200 [Elysia marginata]|uniref:Ig-like domain-containing protein n=1 Tax=Elysia marginata TaxID=1093978 RepID=A0AAV4ECY7_9GAST|nr:hypothetical protein ElyMa_001780200 [Elysia marginata]